MMSNMLEFEMLTIEEVSTLLKMGESTIRKQVAYGRFPRHVKIGGACRWEKQTLIDWVRAGCPPVIGSGKQPLR